MAPNIDREADHIRDKARKDLLALLEGVSKAASVPILNQAHHPQVRGKKNVVLSKDLTGPLGLFVSFATLKDYGVEKVFELENGNTDSSQRNIIYIVHGEKASSVQVVAGKSSFDSAILGRQVDRITGVDTCHRADQETAEEWCHRTRDIYLLGSTTNPRLQQNT
jgi:hypothetical protein